MSDGNVYFKGKHTWKEVSAKNPCPACKNSSWCRVSDDGTLCACRRSDVGGEHRTDKNGESYYLHRLIATAWGEKWPEPQYSLADCPKDDEGNPIAADAEHLTRVYRRLLQCLPLYRQHAEELERRGIKDGHKEAGYRSLGRERAKAVQHLIKNGMEKDLPSVPGFYVAQKNSQKFWSIAGIGGLTFPIHNAVGRIVALSVRLDDPQEGKGKYRYVSSKKYGGPGPGSPIHVPLFDGDKDVVRVTEGALKANVATRLSGILTIGLPGVASWKRAARILDDIGAKTVRVAFDADARRNATVARCLSHLIDHLRGKGFDVQLEIWKEEDGKGIDDLLAAGKTPQVLTDAAAIDAAVAEIVTEAEKTDPTPCGKRKATNGKCRPTIILGADEYRINDEAIAALSDPKAAPEVYQRGNQLVRVLRAPKAGKQSRLDRPEGTPRIAAMPYACVSELLTRVADFVKVSETQVGRKMTPAHPPDRTISAVLARGHYPTIRGLDAVIETPTLRPDGTILDTPGWDAETGLLYEPNADFVPVPEKPTRGQARPCVDRILDLVQDFPFAGESNDELYAHRAAWLAALLTSLARFAIAGPCPLFFFDANCPGAGKTLLTDIIAIISTGRPMSRTAFPEDEAELRKRITAIALAGDRLMLFDNIAQGYPFGGAALDAALTATTWRDRILGKSEMTTELPLHTVFFATGNNVTLKGDVQRRVVPCRLETKEENPEFRAEFKHPALLQYVYSNRPQLVCDALTILRAYTAAGCPQSRLTPFGGYEAWSGLIRQAAFWVMEVDPCDTRAKLSSADPALSTLAALLEGWEELPGGKTGETVADVLRYLNNPDSQNEFALLRGALMEWSRTDKLPGTGVIGYKLRGFRRRVVGGRMLDADPGHGGVQKWRVVQIG